MDVINETGLQAAWLHGRVQFPGHSLSLIVKGTFKLAPGAVAALEEAADQPPVTGDAFYDDEPENGCRYESDFVHFKPRADLVLVGTCHAPGGQAVPSCRVSFGFGERVKSLAVFGERQWVNGGAAPRPSEPAPFTSMPIDYRQAFGGEGFAHNPLGKGAAALSEPNGATHWPLPNVVDPRDAVGLPGQATWPAGFAPLGRLWPQRRANMGTYDEAWQKERWPWYPADFDWSHFNAAPADQQLEGYLSGDEALYFENLHPAHAEYRCRLPGQRVRCFLHEDYQDQALVREVPMKLDTLWVDMDAEQAVLLWRGLATVQSEELEELRHLMVVTEPLSEAAQSTEHYAQQLAERLAAAQAAEAAEAEPEPEAPEPDTATDFDPAAVEAEAKAEVMAALDEMEGKLEYSHVDFARVRHMISADDTAAALETFLAEAGIDPDQVEALNAKAQDDALERLKKFGLAPEVAAHIAAGNTGRAKAAPAADAAAKAAAPGAALSGADLEGADFAGRDLKGADFRDAILSGANFAGADLSGATLAGATLEGANLREAKLVEAKLEAADLTGADLTAANLEQASLAGAVFEDAVLVYANLAEADGTEASFVGADLSDANLQAANLEKADLSRTKLTRANLKEARLARAELGEAEGEAVAMTGAEATELRAGGCRLPGGAFQNLRGAGSLWYESDLAGADFTASELERADFRESDLQGSNLHAADLKSGNLTKARLRGARVTSVNLFQARLDKADLGEADLSGSNCYEADFLEAVLTGTKFERANLKNTKLASLGERG